MVINEFPDEDSELLKSLFNYTVSSGLKNTFHEIRKHLDKLQEHGMLINKHFKREAIKKLANNLYELRPDNIRITFSLVNGEIWLLSWFNKKSNKTPKKKIKNAQQKLKKISK